MTCNSARGKKIYAQPKNPKMVQKAEPFYAPYVAPVCRVCLTTLSCFAYFPHAAWDRQHFGGNKMKNAILKMFLKSSLKPFGNPAIGAHKFALRGALAGLLLFGTPLLSACTPTDKAQEKAREKAQTILAQMTLEEKIGQVIQGDISTVSPQDAKNYNLGSVLNGGNSAPGGGKTASWQAWIDAADAYWRASTDTSDGGLGIPLLWGTDAVHGHNNLQMAVIFPHNSALGATGDADLLRRIGKVTAHEVKATGLDWVFAPTLAVARDDRWGRAYESYSEDQKLVSKLGEAILQGLQGRPDQDDFLGEKRVVATAKHFVGDGGTQFGIDKGDTIGSLSEIKKIHAFPYDAAIDNKVQTVMASFSSVNGEKMHGATGLLTGILRDEMGFDGFVIGDWNGHAEIPGCTATDCPDALLAGVDMYMAPDSWKGIYETLLAQVKNGTVPVARLDEAVTRILTVKIRAGLFEAGLPSKRPAIDRAALGQAEHQAVGREAVRKSLVMLKNNDALLPFDPRGHIAVVGAAARSMSQQTGGWTLSWQGDDNANDEFETGETIYEGLRQAVTKAGGKISYAATPAQIKGTPDVVIYVFGEKPYAEFKGDMSDLVFEFADGVALADLTALQDKGLPVVSVFLTGRPLWVNPHISRSDAFIVGWLPGTQGAGIADVLAANADGTPAYNVTGKLSFSWPASGVGAPIDATSTEGVQFPFGYGLDYSHAGDKMAALSEAAGITPPNGNFDGVLMARGEVQAPFGFYFGDSSNWKTPAKPFLSASLGNVLASRGVDYRAQEDARQLSWRGKGDANGRGLVSVQTQRQVDLTALGQAADLSLAIIYRLDKKPSAPVLLAMGCGDNCGAQLDITKPLQKASIGTWQSLSIPLRCFTEKGLKASAVNAPFLLETNGAMGMSLTRIAVTTQNPVNSCP